MTFVFPVLLGGLVLAGVPILLHLIMRQKPKHLLFPAFRFLLRRHRTNLRKLRLRHLLLLALRVLLIALVCLAVAQPKLYTNRRVNPRDQPVAAVLVIDTGVRMGYVLEGKPGVPDPTKPLTVLDEAKRRAKELLDQFHKDSRVAVIDTANSKKVWMSRQDARARVDKLVIRPANFPVTQRLGDVYSMLATLAVDRDPANSTMPRFVFVFSDRTRPSWDKMQVKQCQEDADRIPPPVERFQAVADRVPKLTELLRPLADRLKISAGPALVEQLHQLKDYAAAVEPEEYAGTPTSALVVQVRGQVRELIRQLRLARQGLSDEERDYRDQVLGELESFLRDFKGAYEVYVDVGVSKPMNLAVDNLELPAAGTTGLPRQVFSRNERFFIKATIRATGDTFNQRVDCLVDGIAGKIAPQQVKDLANGRSVVLIFKIDCAALKLGTGLHYLEVAVQHVDTFAVDDTRYATFEVRRARKMLTVADQPRRAKYWEAAVEVHDEFESHDATVADFLAMSADQLAKYKVICLFEVSRPDTDVWARLDKFVRAGGSLVVIPPSDQGSLDETREAYNSPQAQRLLPGQLRDVIRADRFEGALWNWKKADYTHPLLRAFQAGAYDPNTDFIKVPRRAYRYWEVAKRPDKQGQVLVRYDAKDARPALLETRFLQDKGAGRVLLLTTTWDGEDGWNNYIDTLNSFTSMFPKLTMDYLAGGKNGTQLNFLSGQPVWARLPAGKHFPPYNVEGPLLEDASATLDPDKNESELRVRGAVQPGTYPIYDNSPAKNRVTAFSVNLPPGTSDFTRVSESDIGTLFGPQAVVPLGGDVNLLDALRDQWNRPLEFFRWLLVLLVLFLVGESFLANKFYRRDPDGPTPPPPAEPPPS